MKKRDEKREPGRRGPGAAIVFFILLAALTVAAFIVPLRPTLSLA
jgi:hypothetical protein